MPEFRQNLATKEWIIIASERAKRPEEFTRLRPPAVELPVHDATCPFCPGAEGKTPPAVLTIPHGKSSEGWDVCVVPNKFPALVPDEHTAACSSSAGPYLRREGIGHHEVVIETPLHNRDIPLQPLEHVEHIVAAYHARYLALSKCASTEMVVIFRNHGVRAGTSIIHPHSQIVASSIVPFLVRNRVSEAMRYYDAHGRCVFCDMLRYEHDDGRRIVLENEHFIAYTPYASSAPYEIVLQPKTHHSSFGTLESHEYADLAFVLQNLLARLWRLLDDPDYNYVIDTAPIHMTQVPFYHWALLIYPRLTTRAGFEIGSGIVINVVAPEEAARQLRVTDGARLMPGESYNSKQ